MSLHLLDLVSAADYLDLLARRTVIRHDADAMPGNFDGLLVPTVPDVAPAFASLIVSDEACHVMNQLMLRNCFVVNVLDRCAITLPIPERDDPPVGTMIVGETMRGAKPLEVVAGVEEALSLGIAVAAHLLRRDPLAPCCQRVTVPLSMSKRSRMRPIVWSTMSCKVAGLA